jgi:Leucine-rich repeat (LRR) protein
MLRHLVCCFVGPAFLILSACQEYDFKVNDKIVYTPTPLFRDYAIPDTGLNDCVNQAINDGTVTTAPQLMSLDCSFAGIESVEGLAIFTGLKALRLSANQIRNLVELSKITTLEAVYLDDNKIIDPVPLYGLVGLRDLDLSGNSNLQCPKPGSLTQVASTILPQHCR